MTSEAKVLITNLRAGYKVGIDHDTAWESIFKILENLDERLSFLEQGAHADD